MGKSKAKNVKSGIRANTSEPIADVFAASTPALPLTAADGHSVEGWAEEDIRTYNELLHERAKLEKEKNELEQKSSRHQTQRALLNENATTLDSLFKPQLGGEYKFTGSGACCLDIGLEGRGPADLVCTHEICSRAKTKGLSWMEMDTIKYYHERIQSEKSVRMQKALRKQRDVELVRVKKDDDEEAASRARKSAQVDRISRQGGPSSQTSRNERGGLFDSSTLDLLASKDFLLDPKNSAILEAAKENEHIVRRIRSRLDKIRHDVNAGRVSPTDARAKLDQANTEMAEAERKNNAFRQMILDTEPALSGLHPSNPANLSNMLSKTLASSNADAFSQALNVMKGFFSASDPHDVQTAITDLRSVLELNGPMSPVLQKSFQALEEMLAKPNAKGFTVDVTTSDGKTRTCNNVVEVMMNLRLKMQGTGTSTGPGTTPPTMVDPDLNLDEDTIKANYECMKIEESAKREMEKEAERLSKEGKEAITTTLKKIKAKAVLQSPIPPLSDIVLDDVIGDTLLTHAVKDLVAESVGGGTSPQVLSGKVTSLVISTARNRPEKYMETLAKIRAAIDRSPTPGSQDLAEAVSKVKDSMEKFVANHEEKRRSVLEKGKATKTGSSTEPVASKASEGAATPSTRPTDPEKDLLDELKERFASGERQSTQTRSKVVSYYRRHLGEGLWKILTLFTDTYTRERFSFDTWLHTHGGDHDNMRQLLAKPADMLELISYIQERGFCPGLAAVIIAQRLTWQIREDLETTKSNTLILGDLLSYFKSKKKTDWFRTFNYIAETMTDLLATMLFELSSAYKEDVAPMAADIVGMVSTFTLLVEDSSQASVNLRVIQAFLASSFIDYDKTPNAGKLQEVFSRFQIMCHDSRYRCSSSHPCKELVKNLDLGKSRSLVPAPLRVDKSKKALPEGVPYEEVLRIQSPSAVSDLAPLASKETDRQNRPSNVDLPHVEEDRGESLTASQLRVARLTLEVDEDRLHAYRAAHLVPPQFLLERVEQYRQKVEGLESAQTPLDTTPMLQRHQDPASQSTALFGEEQKRAKGFRRRRINVHHVSANITQIHSQAATRAATQTGETKRKDERETSRTRDGTDGAILTQTVTDSPRSDVSAPEAQASEPPQRSLDAQSALLRMTEREKEIQQKLLSFVDRVMEVDEAAEHTPDPEHKHAFIGVAKQLETMALGHIEMAWIIANVNGMNGLKKWLEGEYAREGNGDAHPKKATQKTAEEATMGNESAAAEENAAPNIGHATSDGEKRGEGEFIAQTKSDLAIAGDIFIRRLEGLAKKQELTPQET